MSAVPVRSSGDAPPSLVFAAVFGSSQADNVERIASMARLASFFLRPGLVRIAVIIPPVGVLASPFDG